MSSRYTLASLNVEALAVGQRVTIHGLQSEKGRLLNGHRGELLRMNEEGHWVVKLDSGDVPRSPLQAPLPRLASLLLR